MQAAAGFRSLTVALASLLTGVGCSVSVLAQSGDYKALVVLHAEFQELKKPKGHGRRP